VILLDASILSAAYRRNKRPAAPRAPVTVLGRMIRANFSLGVPGIVLQEVLAGVRSHSQFQQLKSHLAAFPLLLATEADHVEAARITQACLVHKVLCSAAEALIAAQAVAAEARLFTLDRAYSAIAQHAGFQLFDFHELSA
jgi:predicted nucleic acid-binding protein